MTGLLDLDIRRRFVALVEAYPGLHVRELARQLGTSAALVEYHLSILRDNGLVEERRDERYLRVYPAARGRDEPTPRERTALAALRSRLPLRIVLYLLDQGEPVQHKRIAADLGIGKSKLSFHLRKLEEAGLVRKVEGLFDVVDRRRALRLLLDYQPTPDLREEFAQLWDSLYGSDA